MTENSPCLTAIRCFVTPHILDRFVSDHRTSRPKFLRLPFLIEISVAMISFDSLPIDDILPIILDFVQRRADLATLCQVNSTFDRLARPVLYRWIRMFGKDLAVAVVGQRFTVLSENERLCRMIKRFEIRVYPLSFSVEQRRAMESLSVRVLQLAVNITELVWTRKGALSDRCVSRALNSLDVGFTMQSSLVSSSPSPNSPSYGLSSSTHMPPHHPGAGNPHCCCHCLDSNRFP